jgi:hypothetical protein
VQRRCRNACIFLQQLVNPLNSNVDDTNPILSKMTIAENTYPNITNENHNKYWGEQKKYVSVSKSPQNPIKAGWIGISGNRVHIYISDENE